MLKLSKELGFTNEALLHSKIGPDKSAIEELHGNAPTQASLFGHIHATAQAAA